MRTAKIILPVCLIVALAPYLVTCFYALPFADDFCFGWTASENISFLQKFLKQYLHWNGRYASDVLVNLHPLTTGSLLCYQGVSFFSIVALGIAVFVLMRDWLSNKNATLSVVLFFLLFYLCYMPDITEGVYWYIGLVNYHWGAVCFFLQLALLYCYCREERGSSLLLVASLLMLFVSIGFNEVAAAIIPVYYLAAFIYFKERESDVTRILLLHFFVAFVASALVIFSPGNFTRENVFPGRFKLGHSLLYASMQTVRFIGQWSLSFPFIALSMVVIAKADAVKSELIKKTDYKFMVVLAVFTVFMAAFLPYMATGILGQHRTMNYVFPFFMILWIASLISFSDRYQLHVKLKRVPGNYNALVLSVVAMLIMMASARSRNIMWDFQSQLFQKYRTGFIQRQAGILQIPLARIPALENIPNTFKIVDVKSDTGYWVDKCMKRYYTETGTVPH